MPEKKYDLADIYPYLTDEELNELPNAFFEEKVRGRISGDGPLPAPETPGFAAKKQEWLEWARKFRESTGQPKGNFSRKPAGTGGEPEIPSQPKKRPKTDRLKSFIDPEPSEPKRPRKKVPKKSAAPSQAGHGKIDAPEEEGLSFQEIDREPAREWSKADLRDFEELFSDDDDREGNGENILRETPEYLDQVERTESPAPITERL